MFRFSKSEGKAGKNLNNGGCTVRNANDDPNLRIPTHVRQFSIESMLYECKVRQELYEDVLDDNNQGQNAHMNNKTHKKPSRRKPELSKDDWELMTTENNLTLLRRDPFKGSFTAFDTYKIVAVVDGVTAKEVCKYFWDLKYRHEWEVSIDKDPVVLCTPDSNSVVLYQSFKTVWPIQPRYSIFWSRIMPMAVQDPQKTLSKYCAINNSTNYPIPNTLLCKNAKELIFVSLDVVLLCETRWKTESQSSNNILNARREDIVTNIVYICTIDLGGWAPVSLSRVTATREYPRFMRRLLDGTVSKFHTGDLDF